MHVWSSEVYRSFHSVHWQAYARFYESEYFWLYIRFLICMHRPAVECGWSVSTKVNPVPLEKQNTCEIAQLKLNPHPPPDAFWESLASISCIGVSRHLPRIALLSVSICQQSLVPATWSPWCPWQPHTHSHGGAGTASDIRLDCTPRRAPNPLTYHQCPRERLRSCHLDSALLKHSDTFRGVCLYVSTMSVAVIVVLCFSQSYLELHTHETLYLKVSCEDLTDSAHNKTQ